MARAIGIDLEPTDTHPRWWETDDILMRISELDHREGEIDQRLEELSPTRTKTYEPIQYEDNGGQIGRAEHEEWAALRQERGEIRRLLRQLENEVMAADRNHETKEPANG